MTPDQCETHEPFFWAWASWVSVARHEQAHQRTGQVGRIHCTCSDTLWLGTRSGRRHPDSRIGCSGCGKTYSRSSTICAAFLDRVVFPNSPTDTSRGRLRALFLVSVAASRVERQHRDILSTLDESSTLLRSQSPQLEQHCWPLLRILPLASTPRCSVFCCCAASACFCLLSHAPDVAISLTPLTSIEQRAVEPECLGGEGLVWRHGFFVKLAHGSQPMCLCAIWTSCCPTYTMGGV